MGPAASAACPQAGAQGVAARIRRRSVLPLARLYRAPVHADCAVDCRAQARVARSSLGCTAMIQRDPVRVGAAMFYHGLRALGATSFRRLTKNAGLILCYHNVVWREDDQIGDPDLHIPLERFERQIRWLIDHYDVVSLNTFVDRLDRGASLNETAVITFDDGYAGVFDYAVPCLDDLE